MKINLLGLTIKKIKKRCKIKKCQILSLLAVKFNYLHLPVNFTKQILAISKNVKSFGLYESFKSNTKIVRAVTFLTKI